ncbi:MAG: BspA family leucine-rich repeat surface protein [Candidatus Cyclonatronum sp.]|uniref:BspA family leucine-rich repeat surface protein n=1 Tax=Cyclonatronum sp. TaxID=3024185 RepID=UPI0025BB9802|nr:BspA family leucine-rich repeat surface protein [Cyclonatronum sp.]MCC5935175.1 BspA family leucine-rich repeat surface protein [Balneolales bacterium]MCH8485349.1 BspA family leucine-rich repeat surface protein [Cyclonatronum sp.]
MIYKELSYQTNLRLNNYHRALVLHAIGFALIFFSVLFPAQSAYADSDFYLAENGITVMCPDASFGDSGVVTINGTDITFTKRDREDITPENAATSCTSGVTSMSGIFLNAWEFNEDISTWDTSSVTNMSRLFDNAYDFNQDISAWDVSNVIQMNFMFRNAFSFNQDISGWDVGNVFGMWEMFRSAIAFNQDIGNWDVSTVTNMNGMFRSAMDFSQDLSGWCVEFILSMPPFFSSNSGLILGQFPVWGTCPEPVSIPAATELAQQVTLSQNYPNPFNPTTVISYELSEPSSVSVQVYDLKGQLISVLFNGQQNAGEHQLSFDAGSLSSGVYLYRLQAGSTVLTRKMMLVK